MAKNFPNLEKDADIQVQKHRLSNKMNPKRFI